MRSPAEQTGAEQLRLLVDAVVDYAIFLLDPGGRILTWNAGAARIKGYTAEEIIGQHFSRFYTAPDIARNHPAHELEIAAREGRYEEEGWRLRKDGSRFWANVVITALRDGDGELVGFGKVTRDLSARRAAELESQQFRQLVEAVGDYAIYRMTPDGVVQTWNEGARRIKGYEHSEIVGEHFSRFYTEEDRARDHPTRELEIAARDGRYEEEGWRVRKDGSRFWANVVITALPDEEGELVGFGKVTRDLTDRRLNEEALRHVASELRLANADLERFTAAAAHDLADPLHTIVGLAELTVRRYGDQIDPTGREYLEHVVEGARRMRRLLDGLLAYSRATQHELNVEAVDVASALGNVLAGLRARISECRATVEFTADTLPRVTADPTLLEIVLQNLISNALKFSEDDPRIEVTAERTGEMWRLEVADNGIGIRPDDQDAIFGLFQRLHPADRYAGSGLGLAMALRIIERHGGAMGVEPEPGAGARFWFTLPAAD